MTIIENARAVEARLREWADEATDTEKATLEVIAALIKEIERLTAMVDLKRINPMQTEIERLRAELAAIHSQPVVAWISDTGWTTTSKAIYNHEKAKGRILTPLYK